MITCLVLTISSSIYVVTPINATTISVTPQQAELINWCTREMLRLTDATQLQALDICAEYYLKYYLK
jgi:hypothetical protein